MKKASDEDNLVRVCVWVDKDLRNEFASVVRNKHGGYRGGTQKEMDIALRRHVLASKVNSRYRNDYMEKLLNLAAEFEELKGYPKLPKNMMRFAIKTTIGKDKRTVQKYLTAVLTRSKRLGGTWAVEWDVSPFVKEVYKCNRDGINPKHIVGVA